MRGGPFGRASLLAVVTIALVLAPRFCSALEKFIADEERFPGWRGELPEQVPATSDTVGFGVLGQELWRGKVEQVSWSPRAFVYHNFLSNEECEHLKALAKKRLTKSTVVDNQTGKSMDSSVRTSSGTFLACGEDEVVRAIEKRISLITMIPEENGEAIQILKYVDGQKYEPHTDYFHDKYNARQENGGQRVATVLMYLATPEEGGETVFPYAEKKVEGEGWSECARRGLAVKAVKGNALLFYSLKPNGVEDNASTHGSCPTLAGEKWSATRWIHVAPFQPGGTKGCVDDDEKCEEWAVMGECKTNPAFMLAKCRKSCDACEATAAASAA
ncbi:putative prolyl 4-hydroxylase 6 isoform B [Micractinium conductrix]|uniref:procollagen-proline 4-dioxygenase n=1 Tax=Micractinium conductrix TaxID=554055 RepID=A0A2P6VAU6_9CHLO|nr:putative prolyl 4-hydroxylase 6 isoform B [Micractinium conductrix]|eukprot:PSC71217.1 putative prolyl 4-hydroxylase 6 isoform B [Micractinium conductrix]